MSNLKYQKELWEKEYDKTKGLPTSKVQGDISSHIQSFSNSLAKNNISSGLILDIGCGLGQDSYDLARFGYFVYGFDISHEAIKRARKSCPSELAGRTIFEVMDGTKHWNYQDNFFTGTFDGTTFINFISERDINHYLSEVSRVTKNGGYSMFVTPVLPDEYYTSLVREQSSNIVKNHGGLWQRVYRKDELLSKLEDYFEIKKLDEIKKVNRMFGKPYKRTQLRILCKNEK